MRRTGRVEREADHDPNLSNKDGRGVNDRLYNQRSAGQYISNKGVDFGGCSSYRTTKSVGNANISHNNTARTQSHLIHHSAEVFSIIAKMFINPIRNPTPSGSQYLPSGTEILMSKLEESYTKYSPVMWADPLLPYELIVRSECSSHDNVPAVEINVHNRKTDSSPALRLSAVGEQVEDLAAKEISQIGGIPSLISPPELMDPISLATIIKMCDIWTAPSLDEAAIVRLLLLQTLTIDAHQQAYVSSAINQFAINMSVKRTDCKLVWTPAIDTSEKLQIGVATTTSNLYFRTIDEYAALAAGTATEAVYIRDKTKNRVDISDIVFIPVKSAWRGQAWLVPYILSFTTTSWWNHAVTVDVAYSNAVPEKTAGTLMKARFLPRASTVYIPGSYRTICLIIVDSTKQSLQDVQKYPLCRGIQAERQGNFDFAKQIYAYLGRRTDDSVCRMKVTDITQALNHMKEHMCTSMDFRKLHVKTSVLATSKFNGYGCYPNPDPPPKVTGDRETYRNNIFGPAQFNAKNDIKVGEYVLPDLVSLTNADRTNRLLAHQTWRCDPLGYLAYGLVNTSRGASHKPCLYEYRAGCLQYQLAEASPSIRILRACGIFSQDPDPERYISREPFDVFNATIGYGSLILGLTNWAFVELGVSIFEHNRLSKAWRFLPDRYLELWPLLTDDFVIRSAEFVDRLVDIEKYKLLWGWISNISTLPDNVDLSWMDTHYSWNCPWWYVAAIATKFGHTFKIKTKRNGEFLADENISNSSNMLGWLLSPNDSGPCDLSLLTSSNQYEKKARRNKPAFFEILTPTFNGKTEAYHFISWDINRVLDSKKTEFHSKAHTSAPDTSGIVELNVIIFPRARMSRMQTYLHAFVSSDNRVGFETMPFVSGGLRWPNFSSDWVLKAGFDVLTHLKRVASTSGVRGFMQTFLSESCVQHVDHYFESEDCNDIESVELHQETNDSAIQSMNESSEWEQLKQG